MLNLKDLLCESLGDKSPINESIKIGDLQKWVDFSSKSCPGEAMERFNANLLYFFNQDKKEWKEMEKKGYLEDFLCREVWDNWFDDETFEDLEVAKEFWAENYEKFFKF